MTTTDASTQPESGETRPVAANTDLQVPLEHVAEQQTAEGTDPEEAREAQEASEPSPVDDPAAERRRIEEQLEALRKREFALRRELAKADHPELAEPIRELEGFVYRVSRADAKLAEGFSKAEQRRRNTLTKKLEGLVEKRDALDARIAELQSELSAVGEDRIRGYEEERRDAMQRLVAHMGAHTATLREAGFDPAELMPEIGEWMDEIRALAEELAAAKG